MRCNACMTVLSSRNLSSIDKVKMQTGYRHSMHMGYVPVASLLLGWIVNVLFCTELWEAQASLALTCPKPEPYCHIGLLLRTDDKTTEPA